VISVIVCSRNEKVDERLTSSLDRTIGCKYEIIEIDNTNKTYSIFEAYNLGISLSKFNYLCFIHDDIVIQTEGWGNHILNIFGDNINVGLIGIAGSTVKTLAPSAWWDCDENDKEINITHRLPCGSTEEIRNYTDKFSLNKVASIDGVFMCYRKSVGVSFNENMKGFHGYDLQFSIEIIQKGFKVVVTKQIDIVHFSEADLNANWYDNMFYISQYYHKILPINFSTNININNLEINNSIRFIHGYLQFGFTWKKIAFWIPLILKKPYDKKHFKIIIDIFKHFFGVPSKK
jgi:GT2 family glycosyltransferase